MPARVLIVEEYPKLGEILGRWLERSGREIRIATDGLHALQIAEEFLPDVMIVDMNLADLNGREVAQRIRQQPWGERTVLIALTGWMTSEDTERSRAVGFDKVLLKPFHYAQLAAVLAEFFPSKHL